MESDEIIVLIFFVFSEGISVLKLLVIQVYFICICLYILLLRLILKLIKLFLVFFDENGV